MIYRLCCSYINESDLRKDLFQNILIRIWRGLNSFENRSSIKTWVYRISVNTCVDFLRREAGNKYISKHMDINDIEVTDRSGNLDEDLVFSEKIAFLYRCINKLTLIDKTVITLYLEDLSYKEISVIVGISEKNVSVKLFRIKKKLNKYLREYEE